MEYAALGAWIVTAAAGTYLMGGRLAQGGLLEQSTKVTRYPALVVVGHPVAALAGLAAWVVYLATERTGYAWAAFSALLVVVLLGFVLFTRWLVGQGGRHARDAGQPFPAAAVLVHGAVAAATIVLVFLTALDAGHR